MNLCVRLVFTGNTACRGTISFRQRRDFVNAAIGLPALINRPRVGRSLLGAIDHCSCRCVCGVRRSQAIGQTLREPKHREERSPFIEFSIPNLAILTWRPYGDPAMSAACPNQVDAWWGPVSSCICPAPLAQFEKSGMTQLAQPLRCDHLDLVTPLEVVQLHSVV